MKTKYEMGWIILRIAKRGRAVAALKKAGFMFHSHAELNNRTGSDAVKPVATLADFKGFDWRRFSERGLEGIAFWITDAQWGKKHGRN